MKKEAVKEKEEKGAEAPQEVGEQQSDANDATGSFLQTHRDTIQPERGLAGAKGTLHCIAVTAVKIFLIFHLASQVLVFGRSPKSRTGQADPLLFAESEGLPVAINFVCQDTLRPAAIAVTIAVYGFPEVCRLVVCLKVQPFHAGIAIHQADVQLRSELRIGMDFSPDDGTNPGLRQTDNAPGDAVGSAFKHDTLLFENCSHQIQAFFLFFSQFDATLYELDDISYVPPDVLQLLTNSGTDCSGTAFLAF